MISRKQKFHQHKGNFLLSIVLSLGIFLSVSTIPQGFTNLYEPVDKDIRKILDAHVDEVLPLIEACEKDPHCKTVQRVARFSWLPNYFVKYDVIRRIEGAAQLDECIKKYGLHHLRVARKYVYRIKGRSEKINNHNYVVVAPLVESRPPRPLSLSQVKQLVIVMQHTQYWDFWKDNLFFTDTNTLTFIDTGFDLEKRPYDSKLSHYLEAIRRLARYFKMDDDAFEYLREKLKELLRQEHKRFSGDIKKMLNSLPGMRAH